MDQHQNIILNKNLASPEMTLIVEINQHYNRNNKNKGILWKLIIKLVNLIGIPSLKNVTTGEAWAGGITAA
jgi:hypothetical protein